MVTAAILFNGRAMRTVFEDTKLDLVDVGLCGMQEERNGGIELTLRETFAIQACCAALSTDITPEVARKMSEEEWSKISLNVSSDHAFIHTFHSLHGVLRDLGSNCSSRGFMLERVECTPFLRPEYQDIKLDQTPLFSYLFQQDSTLRRRLPVWVSATKFICTSFQRAPTVGRDGKKILCPNEQFLADPENRGKMLLPTERMRPGTNDERAKYGNCVLIFG